MVRELGISLREEYVEYRNDSDATHDPIVKTMYYIWKVLDSTSKELGVIDYAPMNSIGDEEIKIKGNFSPDEVIKLMNLVKLELSYKSRNY